MDSLGSMIEEVGAAEEEEPSDRQKEEEEEPSDRQKEEEEEEGDVSALAVWNCGSPLYDAFELVSVCHVLDRHSMILPFSKDSVRVSAVSDVDHEPPENAAAAVGKTTTTMIERWCEKKQIIKRRIKVGLRCICRSLISVIWRKH